MRAGLSPRLRKLNRELLALSLSCLAHIGVLSLLPPAGGGGVAPRGRIEARLRLPEPSTLPSGGSAQGAVEASPDLDKSAEAPAEVGTDRNGPPGRMVPADEIYYPPEYLSKQPRALIEPDLARHDIADADFVGPARLRLWITREGKVVDVVVEEGNVPAGLQAALRESFMPIVFSPAEIDGKAVAASLRIEVDFAGLPGVAPR